MKSHGTTRYTTSDEKNFLKELGNHTESPSKTPQERLQLLKNYQAYMEKRYDWGDVDPAQVATAVEVEIAKTQNHIKFLLN